MDAKPSGLTTPSAELKPSWQPKPYQLRAIKLLLSQASVGLFLDPGLGKTSTVLAALKILRQKGLCSKMLVVAPLRPMYATWPEEVKKWSDFQDLRVAIVHGAKKTEALASDSDIYVINPEGLPWLFGSAHSLPKFDILVVDESSKFKASNTQRFKLLRQWLHLFKRRWILTGTPIPNGLEDLFGQIYILDEGRALGRYITHFRTEFFDRAPWNVYQWTPKAGSYETVIQRISPLILQLSAEEHLQMPELITVDVTVTLSPSTMKVYSEIENDFISGEVVAANAAVAGVKCRQVANGAVYDNNGVVRQIHDDKLEALESLLAEIQGPVLLLYEFQHDLAKIRARFPHTRTLGTGEDLSRTVAEFNNGDIALLAGHPASMGHGLNLQGACQHLVWYGIPWNLEHYEQAIARIYRQGQKGSHVFVYRLVAKNTLDEKVIQVLGKKDATQQGLLQALNKHRQENYE